MVPTWPRDILASVEFMRLPWAAPVAPLALPLPAASPGILFPSVQTRSQV